VLTDAEATYAALKAAADQAAAEQAAAEQAAAEQAAANQAAADAVIAKIADIGEVTYTDESKALIDASRAAYDALTDTQKELVTNYNVLTDAEATYADLKTAADQAAAEQAANQATANAVIAKIADIGEVAYTDDCKALIDAAREAYDALTDTQKELVTNYNVLTDAEKTYADLEAYTGINATPVNDTIKAKGWYDMNGHRLAGKPTMMGIYVKDGKKVIITF
jgi:ATP-dependent Lon protease